jgi:hypothetical protein
MRQDLRVIGRNPIELEVFRIGFYPLRNVVAPPIEVVDELVDGLRDALAGLDGVFIIEFEVSPALFN